MFFVVVSFTSDVQNTYRLTVEVSGITNPKGKVYLGIYRRIDDFPKKGAWFRAAMGVPTGRTAICIFEDLPDGVYAIAGFLDENENRVLDKNALGYPTELYGFSNNARETFSAPTFDKASFTFHTERKIKMHLK
jgi:uncharacterized protein (DUF2141 family)